MKNILKNMKKKKGFTLVEVIIVLVIIAILAAVLIPSLAGYIDKANEKIAVTNARNFTMAAQTVFSETYAEKGTIDDSLISKAFELAELQEKTGETTNFYVNVFCQANGKITKVVFYDLTYVVTYENGKFEAKEATAATKLTASKVNPT